jgi:2-C-methyl-D-erythritol 4-phosphate cytidylyltransferase
MLLCTIIPAAGSGKRFGRKKQFCKFIGKPVVFWAIEKFYKLSYKIIVPVPEEDVKWFTGSINRIYSRNNKVEVIAGGKERYDTVKLALARVPEKCGIVAIHDAVRPLIKKETIKRCINQAIKSGAAVVAVPSKDTVKIAGRKNVVKSTVPRDSVWLIQTPQIFKTKIIVSAYNRLKQFDGITDDSMVAEKAGYKVTLVCGEYSNIKITERQDLPVAVNFMRKH